MSETALYAAHAERIRELELKVEGLTEGFKAYLQSKGQEQQQAAVDRQQAERQEATELRRKLKRAEDELAKLQPSREASADAAPKSDGPEPGAA